MINVKQDSEKLVITLPTQEDNSDIHKPDEECAGDIDTVRDQPDERLKVVYPSEKLLQSYEDFERFLVTFQESVYVTKDQDLSSNRFSGSSQTGVNSNKSGLD